MHLRLKSNQRIIQLKKKPKKILIHIFIFGILCLAFLWVISAYIQYFSASKSKVTNIKEQTVGKLVSDSVITKVVGLIENLLVVKYQIKLVDSLSNGQRHISIIPTLNDSINGIYSVKVAEDNGQNYVSYFNFLVDAKTMKVLNPNGESVVK